MLASMAVRLTQWLHAGAAAFQFLTRFPVPVRVDFTGAVLVRSTVFYPAAGAAIGLVLAAAGAALAALGLPPMVSAALLLAMWTAFTGGLHLDGLMDTADGVLSHRSRERMLEIMKDSRVGAMGVIACVLYMVLKFALIYSLLASSDFSWIALLLAPVWSRWTMVLAIAGWPYARTSVSGSGGGGLGSFFQNVNSRQVVIAALVALVISIGFGVSATLVSALTALAIGWGVSAWLARKLGGLTGDTYGAVNEITEIGILIAMILLETWRG